MKTTLPSARRPHPGPHRRPGRAPRTCLHALALAALQAAVLPGSALAQDVAPPPPVVVIGVSPLPGLGVARDRVPANAQTATGADIERSGALDITSYINRRLGSVYINDVQNNPLQPDINYRGYTASPLLGSAQGLSIYMDGVRLNQPFGDVVSWDLLPKSAISSLTLVPGSNPLFGLNTLGGALSVQTKDGRRNPGTSAALQLGSHGRSTVELQTGGSAADSGWHWYATGVRFKEDGWRTDSNSEATQLFGKVGRKRGDGEVSLTLALADTDLNGNGLQDFRELQRDYKSVYSRPDNTRNRSALLNLALTQGLGESLSFTGNLYWRKLKTTTYNGDVNDDSLDQATYQPNAAERAALTAAGYTGFPTSGETAANTPFPKWRCIANALRLDEPAEKCNGVINQTRTDQRQWGLAGQLNHEGTLFGVPSQSVAGIALDFGRSRFVQGSELGYLNPDRTITGVGAFGDGVRGGDVDGEPYDTRVDLTGRTRTASVFGSSVLNVAPGTHLTLSGRYNRFNIRNRDAITPGGATGSLDGDHTYSRFNPAIGLTFTPMAGLNGYVGVNQGSRAPSSVELGCADPASPCKLPNAFAGDPPLKQVVTTTVEAGLRGGRAGAWAWNVGLFRSDNRDDLLFVADDAAGFGYFRNFGKTRRQGLELGLSAMPAAGITLGAQLTLLEATYRSPETVNGSSNSSNESAEDGFPGVDGEIDIHPGDRIPLVPRRLLKLYAQASLGAGWSVGVDLNAAGSMLARGNENGRHQPDGRYYLGSGRSPGYAVVNLTAEWKPAPAWTLSAGIANLFDRRYSTAAQLGAVAFNDAGNFEARPFPANSQGVRPLRHSTFLAPGAPRAFSIGVKYSFGG